MRTTHWFGIGLAVLIVTGLLTAHSEHASLTAADAESSASANKTLQPVEEDMHEFMEYVFDPTYKRLKAAMANPPADNNTWKSIKSDALILAEGGNLLLIRKPDEQPDVWTEHSVVVRELGKQLYGAARKKNYDSARAHYTAMLTKCNSCHNEFAGGEHQLKP